MTGNWTWAMENTNILILLSSYHDQLLVDCFIAKCARFIICCSPHCNKDRIEWNGPLGRIGIFKTDYFQCRLRSFRVATDSVWSISYRIERMVLEGLGGPLLPRNLPIDIQPPAMEWKGPIRSSLDALSECLRNKMSPTGLGHPTHQPIKLSSTNSSNAHSFPVMYSDCLKGNLFDFPTIFQQMTAGSCTGKRGSLRWKI